MRQKQALGRQLEYTKASWLRRRFELLSVRMRVA